MEVVFSGFPQKVSKPHHKNTLLQVLLSKLYLSKNTEALAMKYIKSDKVKVLIMQNGSY